MFARYISTLLCCDTSISVRAVLISTMTAHAGLESCHSRTHCHINVRSTRDTCLTLHGSGAELKELRRAATASWKLAWNRELWKRVSGQSDDDARTDVGKAPRGGERTCRDGPATLFRKRDTQESV